MLRGWVRVLILVFSLVVPTLVQAVETEPPLAPELLPLPAVVTPPVIDTMRSVATPTPDRLPVPPEPTHEVPSEMKETTEPLCESRSLCDFWGYRVSESGVSWTLGDGDQFGSFSLDPNRYLKSGIDSGFGVGLGFRFLSGPQRTDMPPRVFDFSFGYQTRDTIGNLTYDLSTAILAASDFEGSSRDGIRLPAHAVGYVALTHAIDLVFGVDYLDRGDIHILPVGGLLLRPNPGVRIELVFPRPRVDFQLTSDYRLYFNGGLGGGTWAIERDSELDDLASLYELQFSVGLAGVDSDGGWRALEFVYLFDRKLEYTSGMGDYDIGSTLMIRAVTRDARQIEPGGMPH